MPATGKRRALGQHFLRDRSIAQRIAEKALELGRKYHCRALLEVGPGRGAITQPILDLLAREETRGEIGSFILSERDRDLASYWRTQFHLTKPALPASVEEGDFLDLEEKSWLGTAPLAVASNLPYSAGTAILTRLARHPDRIPCMVLMFQAEVAHRLRAEMDSKDWGSLSVWLQNRWDVEKLCAVPPGAFAPPPEVQSEVVTLERRETPRIQVAPEHEKTWEGLLKAAFAHRRKMLRSSLKFSETYRKALDASGVDGTKRAEALSWEDWAKLFNAAVSSAKS